MRRFPRVAMVLVLFAAVPAGAQVGGSERVYSFYALRASADGVSSQFEIRGFLPIDEFVGLSSVTSEANLGTLRATSLAAMPDPGDLVLTLPGTLSALGGISGLPDYPAAASADHPSTPEDEVVFAPDGGVGAGRLRAEATADRAAASAAVGDMRDTVGLLPAFSIGSVRTTAEAARVRAGVLEARATSVVSDISISGGLLSIAEVTSEVVVTAIDGELAAEVSDITVSGVELAGTPVGITDDGIVGLGQPVALAPAVDVLRAPLDEAGLRIATTPGSTDVGDDEATARGGSLEIEVPLTVQGFPGTFTLRLAPVTATLQVAVAGTPSPPGGDEVAGGEVADPGVGPSAGPGPATGSGDSPAGPVAAGPVGGGTAAGPDTQLVSVPAPLDAGSWDVRRLYAWMVLGGIAMVFAGPVAARAGVRAIRRSDLRPHWRW